MSVLLLGIGNSCMGDDGIGPYTVRLLQRENRLPSRVTVVDGGTRGLELLSLLEGVEKLVVVDAVRCGQPPGTIVRLTGEEVPRIIVPKLSMNEAGLSDLLAAAELLDMIPTEVILLGMEPAVLEFGEKLSAPVAAQLDTLQQYVLTELVEAATAGSDKNSSGCSYRCLSALSMRHGVDLLDYSKRICYVRALLGHVA